MNSKIHCEIYDEVWKKVHIGVKNEAWSEINKKINDRVYCKTAGRSAYEVLRNSQIVRSPLISTIKEWIYEIR